MLDLIWYFLPMILFLGIITSYQDIKIGKIKNKWVLLGLVYALVVNLILIFYLNYTSGIRIHYVYELFTNFIFSVVVGFGLWYFGVWSAADGKLFIAFSALVPLSVYALGYHEWIPCFTLLLNIFLLSLLFLVLLMFRKTQLHNLKRVVRYFKTEFFNFYNLFVSILSIFTISWFVQILFRFADIDDYLLNFFLVIVLMSVLNKKGRKFLYVSIPVLIIRLFVDRSVFSYEFLLQFIIIIFLWRILQSFLSGSISRLGKEIFSNEIKLKELKPGMVLSDSIIKTRKLTRVERSLIEKQMLVTVKKNDYHYILGGKGSDNASKFIDPEAEGLSEKEVEEINGLEFDKIRVSQTIPFAPLIFLGVLLTILLNGNVLISVILAFF
ncbi:MAG: A24 family peptidase C-terminal domain-containing protein [Nanoarchaeota archaeon]|nr:A24 family peptidase C-terminal domain-containing protein [Nanoarchaeota archaeon]